MNTAFHFDVKTNTATWGDSLENITPLAKDSQDSQHSQALPAKSKNQRSDRPLAIWSPESCRQRITKLLDNHRDAAAFWQGATNWYDQQATQGNETWARACWLTLCDAWDSLQADDWLRMQPNTAAYAVNLFDGKLITPTQPQGD
jgi:hypothetical protein